jgi:hypothetical protein
MKGEAMKPWRLLTGAVTAIALSPIFVAAQATGVSAASPSIPLCSHLVIAAGTTEGGLGTGTVVILIANSGKRCQIEGYPRVQLFDDHGALMNTISLHKSSSFFAEPKPHRIVLSHNGVASVGLSWNDNPVGNQTCPRAAWANITLPEGIMIEANSPDVSATPCGGALYATSIEAGPVPAPNE